MVHKVYKFIIKTCPKVLGGWEPLSSQLGYPGRNQAVIHSEICPTIYFLVNWGQTQFVSFESTFQPVCCGVNVLIILGRSSWCWQGNKNKSFQKGPWNWIWILAVVTRVTGVTDDHLQEAGSSRWSFARGRPPLDDHLQEAGPSEWSFARGRPLILTSTKRAWRMHFWDPSQWDKMCFECQRIKFQWKKGSKCSHLLTVSLTVKFQFFCWCLPLCWKFEIVLPTKSAKKLCFLKLGFFWYLRLSDIGSNKAFISLNHFPQNISFKLHILCPQQSQVSWS